MRLTEFVQRLDCVGHSNELVVHFVVGARAQQETVAKGDKEVEDSDNLKCFIQDRGVKLSLYQDKRVMCGLTF